MCKCEKELTHQHINCQLKGFVMKKAGIDKSTFRTANSKLRTGNIKFCILCSMFCVLFVSCGCGKQMARMEKQQTEMQSILEANSQQLAAITQQLEQTVSAISMTKIDVAKNLKELQNSSVKLAANITALQQELVSAKAEAAAGQTNLVETQMKTSQAVSSKIDALQISHAADIGGLQSDMKQLQSLSTKSAENVAALQKQQISLVAAQQNSNQAVSEKIAALQVSQTAGIGQLQSELKLVSAKTEAVAGQMQSSNAKLTDNINALKQQQTNLAESQIKTSQAVGEKIDTLQISHAADIGGLQSDIKQLQSSGIKLAENVVALEKQLVSAKAEAVAGQVSLAETQQNTAGQLNTGIKNLQTLSSDTAGKVTSLNNEQIKLQQTMQTGSEQLAEKILSIEKKLADWSGTSQIIASDIRKITAEVNALGQNLSKLNGSFQKEITALHNDSTALSNGIDETGKKNLEFQQKFQSELKALTESIGLIKQSQTELEKNIKLGKTADTTPGSDSPAIIEQPKEADYDRKEISLQ
jgi:hypothetical protein